MKKAVLIILVCLPLLVSSQHTFSIVAVDAETGEIGSAGATCLFFDNAARDISDIVLGVGAVNTQAYYTTENQAIAHDRMVAGDTPDQIIQYMQNNDFAGAGGNINDRQYGVVTLNDGSPLTAAYTGSDNYTESGHRLGSNYSIQGNTLISQDVLNDMESAFLNTEGPLCDKIMAVLQAAKRPGADNRCLDEGVSSGSVFIRVAKPTDTSSAHGDLWLDLELSLVYTENVPEDPIDLIQVQFDEFKVANSIVEYGAIEFNISPNPSTGIFSVEFKDQEVSEIYVSDVAGREIKRFSVLQSPFRFDLSSLKSGQYIVTLLDENIEVGQAKLVLVSD